MTEEELLRKGERIDDLEVKGFRIIQNPSFFCFGMDAVLLSSFAGTKKKDRVIDLGTGTGIIPLLLLAKEKCDTCIGLELQEAVAEMAARSVQLNHAENRCRICQGDICKVQEIFPAASFDGVTCNPPYIQEQSGLHNDETARNLARHEIAVRLEDVVRAAAYLLVPGGTFSMVHKPFRIPEILELMRKYRLEPKRMQLVQPYTDKEPNMVLLEAVRDGKPWLTVHPSLVVYEKDGGYTQELLKWYGKA
ncbi:MAG: tRNA1(Val) (adenine(37)-N6)-methyltransferase [Eubacterium sp.]|nr:tRNA1(Val) (adenine(37)-N6)-methyltransferase [Eubacterium sp.]MBR6173192.1 tRNA1(Val) (adenine(37)-N6)-methyltransferase [Eubacterium sp.]